jgi:hypothetical protein
MEFDDSKFLEHRKNLLTALRLVDDISSDLRDVVISYTKSRSKCFCDH